MTNPAEGILDFEEMNLIRDAHRDWCAQQSLDAASPVGEEAAGIMLRAYRDGARSADQLIEACEEIVRRQQEHVRLGAPSIPSRS